MNSYDQFSSCSEVSRPCDLEFLWISSFVLSLGMWLRSGAINLLVLKKLDLHGLQHWKKSHIFPQSASGNNNSVKKLGDLPWQPIESPQILAGKVTRVVRWFFPFHSTGSEVRKGCFRASSADIRRPGCMASNASNLVGKVVGTPCFPVTEGGNRLRNTIK